MNDLEERRALVRQMARQGELVRTSDLTWARIRPELGCECGARAGTACATPSGWHYSRRDAMVRLWRGEIE